MKKGSRKDILDRFYTRVDKTDSCWLWTGGRCGKSGSYGAFSSNRMAHRVSYEIFNGKIPDGMVVMHTCDNGLCVNPNHLSVGTQAENISDMCTKGRHVKREKLERYQADEIRILYSTGNFTHNNLSKMYNVVISTITCILNNKHYV